MFFLNVEKNPPSPALTHNEHCWCWFHFLTLKVRDVKVIGWFEAFQCWYVRLSYRLIIMSASGLVSRRYRSLSKLCPLTSPVQLMSAVKKGQVSTSRLAILMKSAEETLDKRGPVTVDRSGGGV